MVKHEKVRKRRRKKVGNEVLINKMRMNIYDGKNTSNSKMKFEFIQTWERKFFNKTRENNLPKLIRIELGLKIQISHCPRTLPDCEHNELNYIPFLSWVTENVVGSNPR